MKSIVLVAALAVYSPATTPNDACERAFYAAYAVYTHSQDGLKTPLFDGITHYHASYVEPEWANAEDVDIRYYDGYHYFYTNERVTF